MTYRNNFMKSFIFSLIFLFSFIPALQAGSVFDFDEEKLLTDIYWQKVQALAKDKTPKVALVLGGGGARGFSHIGVFKVLQEENIPVDLVVGTSVGSIIGAFYCAGVPVNKLEDSAKDVNWKSVSNFGVHSIVSLMLNENLLSNEQLEEFIKKNIGDVRFDQLKVPLVCVATDLNTGERILLREGSVSSAVRASATIPGFFKPVEYRQRYLVDGGLSENIPVNVAKLFDPDVTIAVAVSADITKHTTENVLSTLMQAIYIQGSVLDNENIRMADVVIRPDVGSLAADDLKHAYQTIDKGFDAARDAAPEIKKDIIRKTNAKYLLE